MSDRNNQGEDLGSKAERLGIEVDQRWSDETLQKKIDAKLAEKPKGKTAAVRILYDTWDENGDRQPKGAIMDMPLDVAKTMIKAGKAERADPLPGDE